MVNLVTENLFWVIVGLIGIAAVIILVLLVFFPSFLKGAGDIFAQISGLPAKFV